MSAAPASRRIPKVGLLIESSRSSGRSLLMGVAEYVRHHGPWAFHWETGGLEKAWPVLRTLDLDGIILRDTEGIDEVLALGIPAIVVGHSKREVPGVWNVITDSTLIAHMAAEHLVDCGFKSFGFVGFHGLPWSDQREIDFTQAMEKAGFGLEVFDGTSRGADQNRLARWLKSLPKPVGIMACNDDRGEHVIEACKVAGLRVPDEVAIIGADNDELVCELSNPPLSSIAINFQRAGYESARHLGRLMTAPRSQLAGTIVGLPTHVVARQSTDIVFIDDQAISRALRFIRHNARRQIAVNDVAEAAGLSRRVLEKRFRKHVGRSVLHEIRRVRVEVISRLLVETNQSISEIALETGFDGIEHVARYFRQEKGMTPLGYRKEFGRQ